MLPKQSRTKSRLRFLDFSYKSPAAFFTVKNSSELLDKNGFNRLNIEEKWTLKNNEKYYVTINDSGLFAFEIGEKSASGTSFRIVGSHTDSPSIKIKPNPEIVENGFLKLNIEIYGGVNNLTDARYASMISVNALSVGGNEPRYYYPGLPRHFFAGLRFNFN